MHPFTKTLSVAIIGLMPVMAHAADVPAPAALPPVATAPAPTFTAEQKAAIEAIVREFLVDKEPETIIKAAQNAQQKQEADSLSKSQQAVGANRDKIFNDKTSPVGGNPKGDVTIVEFFDYQCGYCKMAQENLGKLLETEKNVKIIYKEYPILGPDSALASKAALASVAQGKYEKFHVALMTTKEHLTEAVIFKIAKDVGLDVDKLKKDAANEEIQKIIQANIALGGEVGARGTPTFVIGEQIYPGALQLEQMQEAIASARSKLPAKP